MQPEWFETFFQGVAVEFWNRAIPPALTLTEVDFLEQTLAPPPGAYLLDIPCGSGRHSIELARRGYRMTGIDLSADFLGVARLRAREEQLEVDLHQGDMRTPKLAADFFNGAFCFGNSFPYLDRSGVVAFLAALGRAIRPGGRMVIDTGCAAESILPTLLPQRWHRFDDIIVMSKAAYVPADSRLDIDYTFVQSGTVETRPSSSFVFTVAEIKRCSPRRDST
ncbi:MAG: class I SAM-dependent methyltransferase [Acidobacteriota bacterium]